MDAKILSVILLVCVIQLVASSPFGICGENEYTNGCGSPCEASCDNPDVLCIQVCAGNPCRCIAGHVRHNGKCIPIEDCPPKECPPKAEWNKCGSLCLPSCDDLAPVCPDFRCSNPSCACKKGFVEDREGNCIKKEDCPDFQLTQSTGVNGTRASQY